MGGKGVNIARVHANDLYLPRSVPSDGETTSRYSPEVGGVHFPPMRLSHTTTGSPPAVFILFRGREEKHDNHGEKQMYTYIAYAGMERFDWLLGV